MNNLEQNTISSSTNSLGGMPLTGSGDIVSQLGNTQDIGSLMTGAQKPVVPPLDPAQLDLNKQAFLQGQNNLLEDPGMGLPKAQRDLNKEAFLAGQKTLTEDPGAYQPPVPPGPPGPTGDFNADVTFGGGAPLADNTNPNNTNTNPSFSQPINYQAALGGGNTLQQSAVDATSPVASNTLPSGLSSYGQFDVPPTSPEIPTPTNNTVVDNTEPPPVTTTVPETEDSSWEGLSVGQKISKALAMPEVQQGLMNFGAAIGGPDSVGARLAETGGKIVQSNLAKEYQEALSKDPNAPRPGMLDADMSKSIEDKLINDPLAREFKQSQIDYNKAKADELKNKLTSISPEEWTRQSNQMKSIQKMVTDNIVQNFGKVQGAFERDAQGNYVIKEWSDDMRIAYNDILSSQIKAMNLDPSWLNVISPHSKSQIKESDNVIKLDPGANVENLTDGDYVQGGVKFSVVNGKVQ
jgi:hypothetical protein